MKYFLLLFCLTIFYIDGYNQSNEFRKIENTIQQHITKNRWDDILMLAPDLIIEDPSKGDGYYYTAMAFGKLGSFAKANEYVSRAEVLADESLKIKINTLKDDIRISSQAQTIYTNAEKNESAGNVKKAAAEWTKLWEINKSNSTYALNAVELFIENKQYEEALLILNDPAISRESSAKQLAAKINQTPEMQRINKFTNAIRDGKNFAANEDYSKAISRFDVALELRPSDTEAIKLKKDAQDELAWQTASHANTIMAYEAYMSGRTLKKHYKRAENIVKRSLITFGKQYAEKDDIEQMEVYLNKFIKDYPWDSEVATAKEIMCTAYNRNAKIHAIKKTSHQQGIAVTYYKNVQQLCPEATSVSKPLKKAQKLQTRYGRPNRTYLAYVYDSLHTIGVSIGGLKNRALGVYITARINPGFVTKSAYFTVDNEGTLEGNVYDDIRFTRNTKQGNAEGVFGLTKKIAYPLWLYAGGGVAMRQMWWEMSTYSDSGTFYETEWVKNRDEKSLKPMAEAGIILDFSGFHLRGGVKTSDFNNLQNIQYSAGIGFSFK